MDEILIKADTDQELSDIGIFLNDIIDKVCSSLEVAAESSRVDNVDGDDEFCWEDYLTAVGCLPVDATSFWHVEQSLSMPNFRSGDLVAIVENSSYWPAEIVTTCRNWLHLKPYGSDKIIWQCVENRSSIKALSVARRHELILNQLESNNLDLLILQLKKHALMNDLYDFLSV